MAGEIDEIKIRVDVVDLISEYIRLKQAGTNWKGLCPFHNEKTPSFMASRDKQIWHCFGCGKGGDIFSFIQEIEGVEFAEALKILAQRAGVKLQSQDPEISSQKNRLVDICGLAANFWHKILLESSQAQVSRDYLKNRGVSENTIADFKLGYAPDDWQTTYDFLKKRGYQDQEIFNAGLIVKKDRGAGFYDRFRDRIIFPINDSHGRPVGFSARALKKEDTAKYINTPQTQIYNKSLIIYNLDKAKTEIKKQDLAVMVEGQMDVVSAWQAGSQNVIASSGTALTLEQVQIIKRYTTNLAIAFDADLAGQAAAKRGIDIALSQEINVKVIVLPHGKDPDECIKQNPQDWFDAVQNAKSIMDYYFSQVTASQDLKTAEGKKHAAKILLPIIDKLGNKIEQEHWLNELAGLLAVSVQTLKDVMPKKEAVKKPVISSTVVKQKSRQIMLVEHLLALALKYPNNLSHIFDAIQPEFIAEPDIAELYKNLIIYYTKDINQSGSEFDYLAFKNQLHEKRLADLADVLILLAEKDFFDFSPEAIKSELNTIIHDIKSNYYHQQITLLQSAIKLAEKNGQKAELEALISQVNEYSEKLNFLK